MIRNTIRNTIQNTIRNTLGDDAFNMLNLFSGGQRGVWYDPSDLATMFQESTGGTEVTADGQPVGLMYDKSRGELFGDELVLSNDFTGWVSTDTDVLNVEADGTVTVNNGDGVSSTFLNSPIINLEIGKTYFVEITSSNTTGVGLSLYTQSTGGTGDYLWNRYFVFTSTSENESFGILRFRTHIGTGTLNSISVKEVLGTTATQPVATKRPTYKDTPDRLEIDLVDDALLFDVPTGGIDGYMVVGTNDGTASYGVSLPAGSYELGGDYFPSNTINGFLLREGSVSQADLANVEKDFVSKGAKASYGDVTNFSSYWRGKGITEFPLIDTSSGTNFTFAWRDNNLTSFPLLDTSNGANFAFAWQNNNTLADFPANMFDSCSCTNFTSAFANTGLTQASIDGILVSINSNGTSNGTFGQSGGSAPSATGQAAIDAMRSRGWTITVTGGY